MLDIVINLIVLIAIIYLAYRFLYLPFKLFILSLLNYKRDTDNYVFLEITPPSFVDRKLANKEFITTVKDVLSGYDVISLELIGTFNEGIRFIVRAHSKDIKVLQKHLSSHLSDVKFKRLPKKLCVNSMP